MAQCGPTREIKAWATTDDFQQEFICQPHLQVWPIFSPLEPLLKVKDPASLQRPYIRPQNAPLSNQIGPVLQGACRTHRGP